MTSPVRVARRHQAGWERPLTGDDLRRALACCKNPRFLVLLADARGTVELLPQRIPGRDRIETFRQLAARLDAGASALRDLPAELSAALYVAAGGGLPAPNADEKPNSTHDLAMRLELAAVVVRTAAKRVKKSDGRPVDDRQVAAVSGARRLCKMFKLSPDMAPELASIMRGKDLSEDAYRRAARHLKRKPT